MNDCLEQLYLEIDAAGRAGLPLSPIISGSCLLEDIDNFHRSCVKPGTNQIAELIAGSLDSHPRSPMQDMTGILSKDLGISPREVSKIARSIGFKVVAVRDGQRVFKTLQRGDAVQRRLAQRKTQAASGAGRLAS
jgi:hypothetical protein